MKKKTAGDIYHMFLFLAAAFLLLGMTYIRLRDNDTFSASSADGGSILTRKNMMLFHTEPMLP